ncbi:hypothetical protein AB0I30_09850 [Nocardia tengchongensis]|uniref:hypothetical protein n=1 Tax=Nocardia tengchongensis TaxID=2055889 RepID=UPI0033E59BB3
MAGITWRIHDLGGCPFVFGYGIIGPMQAAAPVPESAGVVYSVLATRGDQVLTPPGPASFIDDPRVENDYFEDLYPRAGLAGHATLPMQPDAAQWVIKQLLSE